MKDRVLRHDAASVILVSAGCVLLLRGNTLPWPCVSGSAGLDCAALVTISRGRQGREAQVQAIETELATVQARDRNWAAD